MIQLVLTMYPHYFSTLILQRRELSALWYNMLEGKTLQRNSLKLGKDRRLLMLCFSSRLLCDRCRRCKGATDWRWATEWPWKSVSCVSDDRHVNELHFTVRGRGSEASWREPPLVLESEQLTEKAFKSFLSSKTKYFTGLPSFLTLMAVSHQSNF